MRVEEADVIPHRKKKESNKSKASARSDHEHYYALAVTHYIDVDSKHTFDSRRVMCIFCNEVHKRFPLKKRSELEVYTENTVYYRSGKNAG